MARGRTDHCPGKQLGPDLHRFAGAFRAAEDHVQQKPTDLVAAQDKDQKPGEPHRRQRGDGICRCQLKLLKSDRPRVGIIMAASWTVQLPL